MPSAVAMLLSSRSEHDSIGSMMRTYELMVVLRPEFPVDDEAKRQNLIESLVGTEGVTISSISPVGKKRLAYPIKKFTEGVYLMATVASRGLQSSDVEKRASLNDDCLRFLLTAKH